MASYDAAQQRISQLISDRPELKDSVAERLDALAAELEKSAPAAAAPAAEANGSADAIEQLKQGFVRFKNESFLKEKALFDALAVGQSPKVMIIGCCDSRVDPTTLLGLKPGQAFAFRNIANMVPAWDTQGHFQGTSSALEYAVCHLKVEHILVMGHRNCGGIGALMAGKSDAHVHDFLDDWVEIGLPARAKTLAACKGKDFQAQCRHAEKESVNNSLANLLTYPWIKEKVVAKTMGIHGWYYDFVEGTMDSWGLKLEVSEPERIQT
eukprot:jgi/Mesen1/7350/ME000377S06562